MTATESAPRSPAVDVVLTYFAVADGKQEGDLTALFADDAEVFFPKYGVGRGRAALGEIGGGLMQFVASIDHQINAFRIVESDGTVVVEGTSSGRTADGVEWRPGDGAAGRFCSVFDIRDGQIAKMSVYLDPDYGNATADRYPWS